MTANVYSDTTVNVNSDTAANFHDNITIDFESFCNGVRVPLRKVQDVTETPLIILVQVIDENNNGSKTVLSAPL